MNIWTSLKGYILAHYLQAWSSNEDVIAFLVSRFNWSDIFMKILLLCKPYYSYTLILKIKYSKYIFFHTFFAWIDIKPWNSRIYKQINLTYSMAWSLYMGWQHNHLSLQGSDNCKRKPNGWVLHEAWPHITKWDPSCITHNQNDAQIGNMFTQP